MVVVFCTSWKDRSITLYHHRPNVSNAVIQKNCMKKSFVLISIPSYSRISTRYSYLNQSVRSCLFDICSVQMRPITVNLWFAIVFILRRHLVKTVYECFKMTSNMPLKFLSMLITFDWKKIAKYSQRRWISYWIIMSACNIDFENFSLV